MDIKPGDRITWTGRLIFVNSHVRSVGRVYVTSTSGDRIKRSKIVRVNGKPVAP